MSSRSTIVSVGSVASSGSGTRARWTSRSRSAGAPVARVRDDAVLGEQPRVGGPGDRVGVAAAAPRRRPSGTGGRPAAAASTWLSSASVCAHDVQSASCRPGPVTRCRRRPSPGRSWSMSRVIAGERVRWPLLPRLGGTTCTCGRRAPGRRRAAAATASRAGDHHRLAAGQGAAQERRHEGARRPPRGPSRGRRVGTSVGPGSAAPWTPVLLSAASTPVPVPATGDRGHIAARTSPPTGPVFHPAPARTATRRCPRRRRRRPRTAGRLPEADGVRPLRRRPGRRPLRARRASLRLPRPRRWCAGPTRRSGPDARRAARAGGRTARSCSPTCPSRPFDPASVRRWSDVLAPVVATGCSSASTRTGPTCRRRCSPPRCSPRAAGRGRRWPAATATASSSSRSWPGWPRSASTACSA